LPIDRWDISVHGLTIWPYIRASALGFSSPNYRPRIRCSPRDLFAFLSIITIRLRRPGALIFCTGRSDVLHFAAHVAPDAIFTVVRDEGNGGNAFLLEAVRWLARRSAWMLDYIEYRRTIKSLSMVDVDPTYARQQIKTAIGDLWFLRLLRILIGPNRPIYFTNCVIPKIEKAASLLNSTEIQHGVIHGEHYDYANTPQAAARIPLVVWNDHWREVVQSCGYEGTVHVTKGYRLPGQKDELFGIVVFTTVSEDFTQKILSSRNLRNLYIQPHPRDYMDYSETGAQIIRGYSPGNCATPVLHDSTLIVQAVENQVQFIYLKLDSEDYGEVESRLLRKYHARLGVDYKILETIDSIFECNQTRE
jgi:hypothetical protein